jgi:phenylacetate-CoA ligase
MGMQILLQNNISKLVYKIFDSPIMPSKQKYNLAYIKASKEYSNFQTMSEDSQKASTLVSLQTLVAYCRKHVPYYRDLLKDFPSDFPVSFEDYRFLPPLEKDVIRHTPEKLISDLFSQKQLHISSTGGSTGQPIFVYRSIEEVVFSEVPYQTFLLNIGGERGQRIGTLYGGSLDVNETFSIKKNLRNYLLNISEHGCFRLNEKYLLSVHADFEKFQPDIIFAYAGAIDLLSKTLEKHGIKPSYPKYSILTAGERLDKKQEKHIENVFKKPIAQQYGSRDVLCMAYKKDGESHYKINNWNYLLEPEKEPDRNGISPILVTMLFSRAMPLLRYSIDDLGRFPSDWKSAVPSLYLKDVIGRSVDFIYLPNQKQIHGIEFPRIFRDYDILLFQVTQQENSDVEIKILPGTAFSDENKKSCEKILKENLVGVHIEIVYVKSPEEIEKTPQNKLRPVISHFTNIPQNE